MPIDAGTLDADPIRQLEAWLGEATDAGVALPNAFALATADGDGMPSVRFVLLHGLDADGLRFYTNRSSRKGRDLAVNPWAAAAFWWAALDRQVRVTGPIRLLSEEDSLAYWRTRPRGAQLSAAASAQSQEIGSRAELEALVRAARRASPRRRSAAAHVGRVPHRSSDDRAVGEPPGPPPRPRRVPARRGRIVAPAPAAAVDSSTWLGTSSSSVRSTSTSS